MSLSNLHGRVLEYIVVMGFERVLGDKITLSKKTIEDNERDKQKLKEISQEKLTHFKTSSVKIVNWILNETGTFNSKLLIERLSDEDGRKGDVTDIRFNYDNKTLNISLKNNHLATKHQRPGPTPKHIGLDNLDEVSINFRETYKKINYEFYNFVKSINQNYTKYNEVEEYKFDNLYDPICNLVCELLNKNKHKSHEYLTFLIGNVNFKKIVLFDSCIEISSFDEIPETYEMNCWVENKNYVIIDFNDDVRLSMRLHTASSRLSETGSLKFDTHIQKMDVVKEVIVL